MQGDGQRPKWGRNFGEIAVVVSDRRLEMDYIQEGKVHETWWTSQAVK